MPSLVVSASLIAAVLTAITPLACGSESIKIVDVVPQAYSSITLQVSEPSIAVDSTTPQNIAISALTKNYYDDWGVPPIFYSNDGGETWYQVNLGPIAQNTSEEQLSGSLRDITLAFSPFSHYLYIALLNNSYHFMVLRVHDFKVSADPKEPGSWQAVIDALTDSAKPCHDQPRVDTPLAIDGASKTPADAVFVGSLFEGPTAPGAITEGNGPCDTSEPLPVGVASLDLSSDGRYKPLGLQNLEAEEVGAGAQDAPSVVSAIASDGTVYEAYIRFANMVPNHDLTWDATGTIVVEKTNNFGSGGQLFQQLANPVTKPPGNVHILYDVHGDNQAVLGNNRVGSALSIAVDPRDSKHLYLSWGDGADKDSWGLHIEVTKDGGNSWQSLTSIPAATNPSIAVAQSGMVGILYQRYELDPSTQQPVWFTAVDVSKNGTFTDTSSYTLSKAPPLTSSDIYQPMLGDYDQMRAINNEFVGAYCANNTPLSSYFGKGAIVFYHRYSDYPNGHLYQDDVPHTQPSIPPSIDPFFFRISGL